MWRPAETMRQHPIPGFQQHRGLADRKVFPDLIAVSEVSDRELSDAIALGTVCDFCARGTRDPLPLGSRLPVGFISSLPADSGPEAEEGSCPVLAATIETSCRW